MTAPTFEPYRVILDYEALQDGFLDRIEDLNTTFEQIEAAGGLSRGNASRLLCKSQKRVVKALGPKSLQQMLKGTGLVLALIVDDERFAPLKEQLAKRKRVDKPAIARIVQPAWLFKRKRAREMGKKRWEGVSYSKRTRLAKRAAKARWRKTKANGALLAQVCQPSSGDGKIATPLECQMVLDQAEAARPQPAITDATRGAAHARSRHAVS